MIVVYLPDECHAHHAGPYIGGPLGGSFVTYICDRRNGHTYPRGHHDSVAGVWWSDVDESAPLALVGSIPTV